VDTEQLIDEVGLTRQDLTAALRALDVEYLIVRWPARITFRRSDPSIVVERITSRAREAVGLWPSTEARQTGQRRQVMIKNKTTAHGPTRRRPHPRPRGPHGRRVRALARAGEILVSSTVKDLTAGGAAVRSRRRTRNERRPRPVASLPGAQLTGDAYDVGGQEIEDKARGPRRPMAVPTRRTVRSDAVVEQPADQAMAGI
jgi:hypothetical protein